MPQIQLSPSFDRFPPSPEFSSVQHDAQRRIVGLWIPAAAASGKLLPNLAGPRWSALCSGIWRATPGGLALGSNPLTSLGSPILPLPGSERPFSLWARVFHRTASEFQIFEQREAGGSDALYFLVNANGSVRYSHTAWVTTAILLPAPSLGTIGITEQPGEPQRIYVNGILRATSGTSTGRATNSPAKLMATGDNDLLALAVWTGRALQQRDFMNLHLNANLLAPPFSDALSPPETLPPAEPETPYHRRIDWPNRPWWRRWRFRKRNY
jgi:hypothetical protein